jgi:type I restriction enzyme R subunit
MAKANQNPEQKARDNIDTMLEQASWKVQENKKIDFNAGQGIAVREYPTDTGPADYVLFVDRHAVGVIEAKPEDWGHKITTVEDQSGAYAAAKLKWITNSKPLPFAYESTGVITRFTDGRDPKPRSREVFTFHRPETMAEWLSKPKSLRARLQDVPVLNPAGLRDCQITAIKNLETSFRDDRPRALVQMATGSGKTFAAITSVYRLLKHGDAKRILFLVDTKNLGEQAEQKQAHDKNRGRKKELTARRAAPGPYFGATIWLPKTARHWPRDIRYEGAADAALARGSSGDGNRRHRRGLRPRRDRTEKSGPAKRAAGLLAEPR